MSIGTYLGHFCDVCFQENGSVHLTSLTVIHICYLLFLDPMKRNYYSLEILWKCLLPFPHFLSFPSLLSLPSRFPSPHVLFLLSFHFFIQRSENPVISPITASPHATVQFTPSPHTQHFLCVSGRFSSASLADRSAM